MYNLLVIIATFLVAGIVSVSTISVQTNAQQEAEDATNAAIAGGFASITTVQTGNQIVITITKDGEGGITPEVPIVCVTAPCEPGGGENQTTVPTDPIIIIPPNNETGQNGTVIVPEPLPPVTNETGGNATVPVEPPVIVIDPDGNVTQVEPPSNVTQIDNGTVIIHPPAQNVTETPGNVTVVDPPVTNTTQPGIPAECGCPITEPPVIEPAPAPVGDNETIIIESPAAPPVPTQLPADTEQAQESNDNGGNNDNNNNGGG